MSCAASRRSTMLRVVFILPCWEKQEVEVGGFFLWSLGSTWDNKCVYVFLHAFTCSFLVCILIFYPCLLYAECLKHIKSLFLILSATRKTDLIEICIFWLLVKCLWGSCNVACGESSSILCPVFNLPMPALLCRASCATA